MTTDIMLILHGTEPVMLTPNAMIQCAELDLRKRGRNAKIRADRALRKQKGHSLDDLDRTEPHAFHNNHVKGATTAASLIEVAISAQPTIMNKLTMWEDFNRELPEARRKPCGFRPDTIRIYKNLDLLKEALALIKTRVPA